jgi:hypothetical protein
MKQKRVQQQKQLYELEKQKNVKDRDILADLIIQEEEEEQVRREKSNKKDSQDSKI